MVLKTFLITSFTFLCALQYGSLLFSFLMYFSCTTTHGVLTDPEPLSHAQVVALHPHRHDCCSAQREHVSPLAWVQSL